MAWVSIDCKRVICRDISDFSWRTQTVEDSERSTRYNLCFKILSYLWCIHSSCVGRPAVWELRHLSRLLVAIKLTSPCFYMKWTHGKRLHYLAVLSTSRSQSISFAAKLQQSIYLKNNFPERWKLSNESNEYLLVEHNFLKCQPTNHFSLPKSTAEKKVCLHHFFGLQ